MEKPMMKSQKTSISLILAVILFVAFMQFGNNSSAMEANIKAAKAKSPWKGQIPMVENLDTNTLVGKGYARAVFAGGCFWCMQGPFDVLEGVKMTRAGFAGGKEVNPSYEDVAYGRTSHTEAVEIWFDEKLISYDSLVEVFWQSMDPTDLKGQFADQGAHYRPVIFAMNKVQLKIAEISKADLVKSMRFKDPIVVPIEEYTNFYPAEEYHQFYYLKNPTHYYQYRSGSGREGFLNRYWKK